MLYRASFVFVGLLSTLCCVAPALSQDTEPVKRATSLFEAFDDFERGARLATGAADEDAAIEEVQYQYDSRSRRRPAATDKARLNTSRAPSVRKSTSKKSRVEAQAETEELEDQAREMIEPAPADANASPEAPAVEPLTPQLARLRTQIRRTLSYYYGFPLNASEHNPWEMMHSIIAYGVDSEIRRGPSGPRTNAIRWLCNSNPAHGERLLELKYGQLNARKGPYVQGHYGQFLAILAQSNLRRDFPLRVGGKEFTIEDLIEHEKIGCDHGMELTFKLIALAHYLELDDEWTNSRGEEWNIPKLVREELKQPIRGAPCGGTHRLMGLSYAVAKRRATGEPIDGEYRRAERFVREYQQYTLRMQNADGSFSTAWFKHREARADIDRRVQTTGHILEWLVFSLNEDELRDPRVVKAVSYLTGVLYSRQQNSWEIGPLGHALHALALYDERVFIASEEAAIVASRPKRSESKKLPAPSESDIFRESGKIESDTAESPEADVTNAEKTPAERKSEAAAEATPSDAPPNLLAPPNAASLAPGATR